MNQNNEFNNTFGRKPLNREVHLTDYLNIIRKHIWILVIFFTAVVSVVTYLSFTVTPVYKATTQIIIDNKKSFMEEMADVMRIDATDKEYYQTQYKLLASRSLAKQVIQENELSEVFYRDAPEKTGSPETAPDENDTESSLPLSDAEVTSEMIDWYLKNLQIEPIRETHLVNISFSNKSPETSARVANAHAHAFIERSSQIQRMSSQQALDWLKSQIQGQKFKVGDSQKAAFQYKYEKLRSFSFDDESIFLFPEIKENKVIDELYKQLCSLKESVLANTKKYGPNHPRMIEANASIKGLEQEIIEEVKKVCSSIKRELDSIIAFESTNPKMQDIQEQMSLVKAGGAINYDILHLEAMSDQAIYDILINQAKEINLTGNMKKDTIRVVDKAEAPLFPSKPRKKLNVLLSVVVGLTFGTGLVFFREYMDNTVKTQEEIVQCTSMPVLGTIPYMKSLKKEGVLALSGNGKSPGQKNQKGGYYYHTNSDCIINRLPFMQTGMSGQAMMVGSATPGEGKTTVITKLAVSMAKGGLRVIMVDADVYNTSLSNLFGLKDNENAGMSNAMEKIRSWQIQDGSLCNCSVDDLFSIISLKKLSGELTVSNELQKITTIFENGNLFHIDNEDTPFTNRLGTMLLRGGFINETQLKDAMERNQRTKLPLGYILINAGYINQEQLKGPIKLQIEEHLQKLFSWKEGTYSFKPGSIETYEDKRVFFQEDFTPVINRLGRLGGSRLLEREILSNVTTLNGSNISLLRFGTGEIFPEGRTYFQLFEKFLNLLKQRYDVVLVDTPPLLNATGSVTPLLPLADGVILVAKSGHVTVDEVDQATAIIKETKTKLLGTIMNYTETGAYYYR
ncbi:MAG: P-loop NTPase [Candidatus Kuenenia stuttgartiensis]|uniref:DUF4388 domain-containing protein n=1 Tax=Kuenenia stuttgartiensis TaxID=174633 RepID=A0A2C9CCK5_KUEST|nr:MULTISPECIES: DUF4388 domain-containing protein [Kuenenia]MBZ0190701.1 P-loop NTPase [Candidatus Kuenenia stuttgartiensis]MCL4727424.1 P-loop NTPase [Candidatus Kuenenia stuttgartiensis]MCZ7621542.1 P-loop NTPase [Candidatus Kuenenia sp.]SOH03441.1 hypothetical protein KSMBR1_0930 [Candidatus Kuenenia stuttgartiensis]